MAPTKRRGAAKSSAASVAPSSASAGSKATATRQPPPPGEPSRLPGVLAALIVVAVALAAVAFEFTTSPAYANSKPLQSALKKSFIAFVCLGVRLQLRELAFGPPRRRQTLRSLLWGHCRALAMAYAANAAGTTVIRPAFGSAPQYEETFWLVVPIYVLVELAVDGLRVPLPVLNALIGLGVGWLKAVTISKLVLQWQESATAHPLTFVAVSTANLFASGIVLRYLVYYQRSRRLVRLSFGVFWSIVKIMAMAAGIGLVAHVANHFVTQRARQLEARALYVVVAWFALHKYWEAPLEKLLAVAFAGGKSKTKRA